MPRRKQVDDLDLAPRRKRRLKRRHVAALMFGGGLLLLLALLPQIVTQPAILVPLANRFAGIAPLKIDIAEVRAGWLAPVSIDGIVVLDGEGKTVAKVASVSTPKGILGWAMNSQDLGVIRVAGVEAAIETGDGTSDVEQLIAPLLGESSSDSESTLSGRIEIVDSRFLLTERGRQEQWVVQLPSLSVTLPSAGQVVGPVELQASIGEASGLVPNSLGSINARIEQVGDSFDISAELSQLPADIWHVVRARMPELPIEAMQGRISGKLAGQITDVDNWKVAVEGLTAQGVTVSAASLLGPEPALLDSLTTSLVAQLADQRLSIDGAQLVCDFGNAQASGSLPWPVAIPSAADPFINGGTCQIKGTVDLPKLVKAAASLIPVREGTQLHSGTAQFALSQTLDEQQSPQARATLTLSGLSGIAAGQTLEWKEPFAVDLSASRPAGGLQLSAAAKAEFVNLRANGTISQGNVDGNIDLAQLHQKISQWVELPIDDMQGTASVQMAWRTVGEAQVELNGQLTTTPISLITSVGGMIHEPAWNGKLSGLARLTGGAPSHLERAKLELLANDEQLVFDLREALALATEEGSAQAIVPAAFTFTLVGDMANWKRRAMVWLEEPPAFEVAGNISLAVGGRLALQQAEIEQASWRAKPLQVSTPQFGLSEAEVVGGFKGRVDTADLTRLQVESLQVQATSFSLGARDSASEDGKGRLGRAKFLVNLGQLLTNVSGGAVAQVLPAGAPQPPATAQLSATGTVEGDLAWNITADAAGIRLVADGRDIVILSKPPEAIAASPLWQEASVATQLEGTWDAKSGSVNLPALRLKTEWCDYTGNLQYAANTPTTSKIVSKGQAVVETAKLSTKLAPMTSSQVQLMGTQTFPVDVLWTSSDDPQASALAGLQATTRIGWEQARVVGVQVGKADVPVTIDRGQLSTAAEIPVSGGMLRWGITGDLTADELVLVQQPMTVLENVAITPEMSKGWLKFVTPLVAEATSVDGRLSLSLSEANLIPTNPRKQTVVGRLVMHSAEVGPGPLSNQVIGFVRQIDAIRKQDFTQQVGNQTVWLRMPEQAIDFQMVEGRVIHRNLNVRIGDVTLTTAGSVDVSGQMDLLGSMPIPDDWIEKSPWLASLRGQSLQIPVRGSLTAPQLDGSIIQQLGRQTVQGAAQGLLERGLSRGFERLFGPGGVAPPTTGQPTQP